MFGLKGRQDAFRLLLPKEFICEEINEKYAKILQEKHGYFISPIDFLNETIQKVNVLGFDNATTIQNQSYKGDVTIPDNVPKNGNPEFMFPNGEFSYRSPVAPVTLTDRTFTIEFKHTLGYLNYFLLYENFWYIFCREKPYRELVKQFNVDIFNEIGSIYCRIVLYDPFMNSMDMLSFDYSQPIANSQTFQVGFKYNNFDFQFININYGDS